MAISQKDMQKLGIFGAIVGLTVPWILGNIVMPILNYVAGIVPGISAKLASADAGTISISVRESLTGINGGLSGWLVDALGLTVTIPMQTYIMAALGGAILMIVGAYVVDMLGFLKGSAFQKTRNTIIAGNIVAGLIIGGFAVPEIGLGLVDVLIAMIINAAVIAGIYALLDRQFKLGISAY